MSAVRCRLCRGRFGAVVLDLGAQPSSEDFPPAASDPHHDRRTPLQLWLCRACGLAQLAQDAGPVPEQIVVAESAAMREQSAATLALAVATGVLAPGRTVVEFGSPHGTGLAEPLLELGARVLPAAAAVDGRVDLVLDVYGLLHEPDQDAALARRLALLRPGGAAVFQLRPLAGTLRELAFTDLRHGHFAYWSVSALAAALARHGFGVHRARQFAFDQTVVVVATTTPRPDPETDALLAADRELGVDDPATLAALQRAADEGARDLLGWLAEQWLRQRRVIGYGAATRAVPLLNHATVRSRLLPAVADASTAKVGRRLPGTDIEVVAAADGLARRPDEVLLLVPYLAEEVRARLPQLEASGGRWMVLVPGVGVVEAGRCRPEALVVR